mgnify:CR=1 FL=1
MPAEHESAANPTGAGQAPGYVLEARLRGGIVQALQLRCERPITLLQNLCGRELDQALSLVPLLLPLCGQAQLIAAQRAVEAARGSPAISLASPKHARREWLLDLEIASSLIWRHALDWPAALGLPTRPEPLAQARQALARAAAAAAPPLALAQAATERILIALQTVLPSPELLEFAAQLDAAAEPAPLSAPRRLPAVGADWFAARMQRPDFCAAPDADGEIVEIGMHAAPNEGGLRARLRARLDEAVRHCARLQQWQASLAAGSALHEAAHLDAGATLPIAAALANRIGVGLARTARGPVAHLIQLDGSRVADWRVLAPSEWNMHPRSRWLTSLCGSSLALLRQRWPLWQLALDPCAPVRLHWMEEVNEHA